MTSPEGPQAAAPQTFSDCLPPLEERQKAFREWIERIRDPAAENSEGVRTISVKGAVADYQISPLPSGIWAVTFGFRDALAGFATPWSERQTREECVGRFLTEARRFFASAERRGHVRTAMCELLSDGGLFGFVEPAPSAGE